MIIVRPSRDSDFDALWELAEQSGPGFTSLPLDEGILRERLVRSDKAFNQTLTHKDRGKYLLMMEDTETGEVIGSSAVKAGIGIEKPFFNYRLFTLAQSSVEAERRFDMDVLVLINEFAGYTEVGTLFVKEGHRGGGTGRLAAQARYLLMAVDPDLFGRMVLAELRGVVSSDGHSAFWEHLGERFFHMSFQEADALSATTDNQFILDLMPKYPIYIDLLPEAAREVIGEVHPDGKGAMSLLEWEGFRYDRVVDVFDGGPLVSAPRDSIRTVRESRRVRFEVGDVEEEGQDALVSSDRMPDFRVVRQPIVKTGRKAIVSKETLDALQLVPGDMGRIWLR